MYGLLALIALYKLCDTFISAYQMRLSAKLEMFRDSQPSKEEEKKPIGYKAYGGIITALDEEEDE